MQLGKPVYGLARDKKHIQISYTPTLGREQALNLTGYPWVDTRFRLIPNILLYYSGVIVITNDYIATNWCMSSLSPSRHVVVFVFVADGIHNKAYGNGGASRKRLKQAQAKLNAMGIKTKFFSSEETCQRYLEGVKHA